MKLFKVFILLAVAGLLIAAGPAENIREGISLFEGGQLQAAEEIFQEILEENPEDERALYYRSQIEQSREDRRAAFHYLNRLAGREPAEFEYFVPREVYQFTGVLARQIGEHERAMRLFSRAQEEAENENIYQQLEGLRQRARAAYLRQIGQQREERVQELVSRSDDLLERGETENALRLLEEHEELAALDSYRSQLDKVRMRYQFEEWQTEVRKVGEQTTAAQLEELIDRGDIYFDNEQLEPEAAPLLARLYYYRGELYLREENPQRAREMFFQALGFEIDPRPQTLQSLARTNYLLGYFYEALENIEDIQEKYPDFAVDSDLERAIWFRTQGYKWLYSALILLLVVAGVFLVAFGLSGFLNRFGVMAGSLFDSLGRKRFQYYAYNYLCDPARVGAAVFQEWFELARRFSGENKLFELLKTRGVERLSAPARLEYAFLLKNNNEESEAVQLLEGAFEAWDQLDKPDKIRLGGALSRLYLKQNDREKAFFTLKKLSAEKSNDSILNKNLLDLSAELGRWPEWRALAEKWLKIVSAGYIQQEHRRGYTTSGEGNKLNDPDSVSRYILRLYKEQSVKSFPEESTKMLELLLELTDQKPEELDLRRRVLEELLGREQGPKKSVEHRKMLADIYERNENYDGAIECYQQLNRVNPNDFSILETLGRLYLRADRRQQALETFEQVFKFQRDNTQAASGLKQLGRRYEDDSDYQRAATAYEMILENSHFEKAEIQYKLGLCLYRQEKYEEALAQYQKIKQGDEVFKARIVVQMARCLLGMGLYDVAVERLSEIDPDNQAFPPNLRNDLHYWTARGHEGEDRGEAALEHYQRILASNVEFRDVNERINNLKVSGE